jgi:hypothetical protein
MIWGRDDMIQKMELKEMPFAITGPGKIDETLPINLFEYIVPPNKYSNSQLILRLIPSTINFAMKIGGTTFDVNTHFNTEGKQSVLEQFKNLILSERLI